MANLFRRSTQGTCAFTLVLGCLSVALPAAGQAALPASKVHLIDSKTASKLVVQQVKPEYPSVAKLNYIQGSVRMRVVVTREGRVGEAHVLHGHPFLAASALSAVRRWVYQPLRTRSGPAEFLTVVEVVFSLHTKKLRPLPQEPEQDLKRQVRPPEVLEGPVGPAAAASVRLRVLVSDEGHAIDSQPLAGLAAHFSTAQKAVGRWTFKPARWGALAVPWYLEVDVPVGGWPPRGGAADPAGG